MQKDENIATIGASNLLKGLTQEECEIFVDSGNMRHLGPDSYLFHQDDPADACCFVLEGNVRLAQPTSGGKQVVVDIISPGRYFGLFVALASMTYPVSEDHRIEHDL